jgi:hypothetical protein
MLKKKNFFFETTKQKKVCLLFSCVVLADVSRHEARRRQDARPHVRDAPIINGQRVYLVPETSIPLPGSNTSCPLAQFCTVTMTLYDGLSITSVRVDLSPVPPVTLRPVNSIALNPFYGGNFPYDNGCSSGVSIYNTGEFNCCNISNLGPGVWMPPVYDQDFAGIPQGPPAISCFNCANYPSDAAPDNGVLTIPVVQVKDLVFFLR